MNPPDLFRCIPPPADRIRSEGQNFPRFETIGEIAGPWNVAFEPRLGGPESIRFDKLIDWTRHDEPGIRHYSGKAVYDIAFQLGEQTKNQRTFLNLGRVKDLAEVRLNGRRLGVLWCSPWRVEITAALQPGQNSLQVTVVNQWVNRLIGDASLPAEKRIARTTWNPYKPDSPLLESGLLGPLRLERMQ